MKKPEPNMYLIDLQIEDNDPQRMKFVDYFNEFRKEVFWERSPFEYENRFDNVHIISKNMWFIKRLVEKDKIDRDKVENKKLKEYNWELIENHKKDIAILCEENKKLKEEIKNRKMYCEEKNENWYSLAIENAELKKQNDNLHEKLWRMQWAFLKFQKKYEEIERELEQIVMIR